MRRILVDDLCLRRPWNWAGDFDQEGMIRTVSSLKGEFSGLWQEEEESNEPRKALPFTITIDGLSATGKTTVAAGLAQRLSATIIDTGLMFRVLAAAELDGWHGLETADLISYMKGERHLDPSRREQASALASRKAQDPEFRTLYRNLLDKALRDLGPCVVIGRDGWRIVPEAGLRVILEADFEVRLRRHMLTVARATGTARTAPVLAQELREKDERDRNKLPAEHEQGLARVQNGRRPLSATLKEIFSLMDSV